MSYTPFGKYFRMLRLKHDEVLIDAKEFLHVSCAYISSVECGKRAVPAEWAELIATHYSLSDKEIAELNKAIQDSVTSVKIGLTQSSSFGRQAAIQFQRSFDEIDDETAIAILKILERNKNGL